MTEWYYADGLLMPNDTTPETAINHVTGESTDWLRIFNLSSADSEAEITYYFEDLPPRRRSLKLPAAASTLLSTHELPEDEMPRKKQYGVRVRTTVPVVVQDTRAEHQTRNLLEKPALLGNTFFSRLAYAGPLGKRETAWVWADGFIERKREGRQGWEEIERLSILNPDPIQEAVIQVGFHYSDERFSYEFHVPPERVRTIGYVDLPFLRDVGAFGVIMRSTIPVVAEQVRRCFLTYNRNPLGGWNLPGCAVGDTDFPLPTAP